MKRLFGTDGVRGVANIYPMTVEVATQLGRAIAFVFKQEKRRHRIVIGKDTRLSGYMIESAMVAGICSMGVDVMLVGPLPTPGIAFITSSMRADAGVVISASHNPYQDNGIKFFSREGFKLPDRIEHMLEAFVLENTEEGHRPTAAEIGKAFRIDDAIGRYIVYLKNTFPGEMTLDGIKIVIDCANGAAYKVAPEVFYELGAEIVTVGVDPDGENINEGCGALYPEGLAEKVKEHKADIGIALDGDGDRCIVVDEKGAIVDGDHIMAICAANMIKEGKLRGKTLVSTIMSNTGLEEAMKQMGGSMVRTAVGDRHVVEKMVQGGYNLGGEQSGHIVFLDHTTTGDGIISALQLLAVMQKEQKKLSELSGVMRTYPQVLVNIKVREKKNVKDIPRIAALLDDVEKELGDEGRVFIRYSGTEPLARITVEGVDGDRIGKMADSLAEAMRDELG